MMIQQKEQVEVEKEEMNHQPIEDEKDEKTSKISTLSKKKMQKFKEKIENRGVIYIARVPPFMKPEKLKHLLSKYGDINRIYLVPEDKTYRKKRISSGGNRKQNYTEGWIEFEDKQIAKRIAKMLNTQKIGGKKRDYYHDDIWNLKYLKGFKWDHLTEKIAYENRIREQKLRMEIAQAKKENDAYMERVEQSKQFEKMEERKSGTGNNKNTKKEQEARRLFHQKAPTNAKDTATLLPASIKKRKNDDEESDLLEKIFSSTGATSTSSKKQQKN